MPRKDEHTPDTEDTQNNNDTTDNGTQNNDTATQVDDIQNNPNVPQEENIVTEEKKQEEAEEKKEEQQQEKEEEKEQKIEQGQEISSADNVNIAAEDMLKTSSEIEDEIDEPEQTVVENINKVEEEPKPEVKQDETVTAEPPKTEETAQEAPQMQGKSFDEIKESGYFSRDAAVGLANIYSKAKDVMPENHPYERAAFDLTDPKVAGYGITEEERKKGAEAYQNFGAFLKQKTNGKTNYEWLKENGSNENQFDEYLNLLSDHLGLEDIAPENIRRAIAPPEQELKEEQPQNENPEITNETKVPEKQLKQSAVQKPKENAPEPVTADTTPSARNPQPEATRTEPTAEPVETEEPVKPETKEPEKKPAAQEQNPMFGGMKKYNSFAEYKADYEKDPEKMQKKLDELVETADKLNATVKQLKLQGKDELAKELNEYCQAIKKVAKPPSDFKSEKDQKEWEKNQEKISGFGQFYKDHRVDLNVAMIAADEEAEAEADAEYDAPKKLPPGQEPKEKEYQGFQDFLKMLIDALMEAFGHTYPELEYEKQQLEQQRLEREKERKKLERKLLKAEMQKEKERLKAEEASKEKKKTEKEKDKTEPEKEKDKTEPEKEKESESAPSNETEKSKKKGKQNIDDGLKERSDFVQQSFNDLEKRASKKSSVGAKYLAAQIMKKNMVETARRKYDEHPKNPVITMDETEAWLNKQKKQAESIKDPIMRSVMQDFLNESSKDKKKLNNSMNNILGQIKGTADEAEASDRRNIESLKKPKNLRMKTQEDFEKEKQQRHAQQHQQLRQQKKQELGMFLDKAEKNGWDVSKNGDREFLETVFKTPGMERVAAGIRTKRLQDELPAADKLIFADQAESAVSDKNMQYSSEMREQLKSVMQTQKAQCLSALNVQYQKADNPRTPEETKAFLEKAKTNGWDADGADKEFLTTFYKTPELKNLTAAIEKKHLDSENPDFDKNSFASLAKAAAQNAPEREKELQIFSSAQQKYLDKSLDVQKEKALKEKTINSTSDFLGKAQKNGWDALGEDREFLINTYMTVGQEDLIRRIENTKLSAETPAYEKALCVSEAWDNVQAGSARVLWDDPDPNKAVDFYSNYHKSLQPKIDKELEAQQVKEAEAQKQQVKEAGHEQNIPQERKQAAPEKPQQQAAQGEADLNPETYIKQIEELNAKKDGKNHAEELYNCSAALLLINSRQKAENRGKDIEPMSKADFDQEIKTITKNKGFTDMMDATYGDLKKPEGAQKLQEQVKKTDGKCLYGDFLQVGQKKKVTEKKNNEIKENYRKKQVVKENDELQLTNKKRSKSAASMS